MNKKLLAYICGLIIVLLGAFYISILETRNENENGKEKEIANDTSANVQDIPADGYKNTTYTVEGQVVALANGVSEKEAAPGSASKITTRYFGNEAIGDLNGDTVPDVVFLLTQESGGSGTFYYVVAAFKTNTGYTGTNAIFLGDRIAPQSTQIENGEIVVNYADRKPGEPMSARPSVGVTKHLAVFGSMLAEKEGE